MEKKLLIACFDGFNVAADTPLQHGEAGAGPLWGGHHAFLQ